MLDPSKIREIMVSQDSEQVDKFIKMLAGFTDYIDEKDMDIKSKPFSKTVKEDRNVLTDQYQQIIDIHSTSRQALISLFDCLRSLRNLTDSEAIERLGAYTKLPTCEDDLKIAISIASKYYSATNYILRHQEITSTKGRKRNLSDVEKLKLRRLKSILNRFFPDIPNEFIPGNKIINNLGRHILGDIKRMPENTENKIIQKSLNI